MVAVVGDGLLWWGDGREVMNGSVVDNFWV